MFHYTNEKGYKAISSQIVWLFKAHQPPGDHPKASYFTTLSPGTPCLAKRLFIRGSVDKVGFVFCFDADEGLTPLEGGRGAFVFYSVDDYPVEKPRQGSHGLTENVEEALR